MKLIVLLIAMFLLASSVSPQDNVVFESGKDGVATYRIPAIVRLKSGKLLAFAEARRKGGSDFGDIDIVMRTSSDGGKSWSAMQAVAENGSMQAGNPAPVVDLLDPRYPRGRIFLFYNTGDRNEQEVRRGRGIREVWYKASVDEGSTWSEPVNITSQVKRPEWRSYANTPGHAIQLTEGKYRGRLLVPINYSKGEPSKTFDDYMASAFYSDDHGRTFKISGDVGVAGSNESTAAETGDGRVLLNARNQKGDQKYRITAHSDDGGASWKDAGFDTTLPDPVCEGSLLRIKGKTLAFANNADTVHRNGLTVRISFDAGRTWTKEHLIDRIDDPKGRDFTAYSDIVMIDAKRIGVLYEKDDYKKIVLKVIDWK